MMRIAIAGGGGFAYLLAQEITQGANAVLVLTRNVSHHDVLQVLMLLLTPSPPLALLCLRLRRP